MKKIAVIGLGLLGASFGMALRGTGYRRLAWARRPEIRRKALEEDVADQVFDTPEETAAQAEFMRQWPEVIQQGFLYGRPEPAQSWLERWHRFHHLDAGEAPASAPRTP